MCPKRIGLHDPALTPPTEKPLQDLALLANRQGHQQAIAGLLFSGEIVRTFLTNPTSYLPVKKHAHRHRSRLILLLQCCPKSGRTGKRAGQHFQLFHPIQAKGVDLLPEVTVCGQIPGIANIRQAVRISLTYKRMAAMEDMVTKPDSKTSKINMAGCLELRVLCCVIV